ncbi:MAG TPA: serine hydrolase [Chryseosolibacter sp.]
MKTALLLILAQFVAVSSLTGQSLENNLRQVDSVFASWDTKTGPGGVVAIIQNGKTIYKKARGMANIKRKAPNGLSTQFELASMAKQFTGMSIALLEEQNQISREDNINKFFPEFRFDKVVKVKNLLDHTSGIREAYVLAILAGNVNLKGEVPQRKNTTEFLLKLLSRERDLNYEPGSEMVYANVNYILLGEIVARVSKQPFRVFVDSAIFKPLNMTHSFIRDEKKMLGPTESTAYLQKKNGFKTLRKTGGIVGDHNLVTTIDDMILWVNNFRENKLGKRDPGLFKKISATSLLNNGDSTRYGYGLYSHYDRGVWKVGHGGDDGGHTCIGTYYPDHDFAVIVLANSSRYLDTENKGNKAAEIFLNEKFKTPAVPESTDYIALPIDDLRRKTGLYYRVGSNGLGQFRRIHLKDSNLYLSGSIHHDGIKLSAVDQSYFKFVHPTWGTSHVHFRDSAGVTLLKHGWRKDPRLDFKPMKTNLAISYADYKGSFWNSSTDATIKVKKKKGKIVARKGIIRIPLIPFDSDLFYATDHDALFIFSRDASGKIDRLTINARDFRNFKMVKR